MNYLAHAFLSGDNPEVLIGNMSADSLRKNSLSGLSPDIVRGIHLHRRIDRFTDTSGEFSACKSVFIPQYGRYAHILVDIAFDHLLIVKWADYTTADLSVFIGKVYEALEARRHMLPDAFVPIFDRMREDDWLRGYGSLDGVAMAYERIGHRIGAAPGRLAGAAELIGRKHDYLCGEFSSLFPKVIRTADEIIRGGG